MTRPPSPDSPLLRRFTQSADAVLRTRPDAGPEAERPEAERPEAERPEAERHAELEAIVEVLAMATALEVVGLLSRVPAASREGLRRAGSRALLQLGTLLDDDDEERAEGARLLGPYARDGLRALAGREPSPARREDAIVLDSELAGLVQGSFDGLRLAEIAGRVRESAEARLALSMLTRLGDESVRAAPRLRLAADGGSAMRDPSAGRRIAELSVAGHAIELHRFDDGAIAAYAASSVVLRLGGEHVISRVSRPGYAEASIEPGTATVDLDVGGAITTLEVR
ncbi:MAG: hypothetical protein U0353_01880 [Sandaracinus sp.]